MQMCTVMKKHRSVQLIRWGRTSLSRRLGRTPLKEVQEEPLKMCQAGEAARPQDPDAGLAPRPASCARRGWGRSSSPQGLRRFGDGDNRAPHFRMGITLIKQDSLWDGASSLQGLSAIIPLLVLPASGHPPHPCCQTELRPPGRTQPTHPTARVPDPAAGQCN